jgi:NADH-quinone oxidoreductase subunit C
MTPEELAAHLKEVTGAIERDEISNGQLTVFVPREKYAEVGRHLRECGRCRFDYFDFLSAIDWESEGRFEVISHLYSLRRDHHLNYKTAVPADDPTVPTLSGIWRGANWHERETFELFGIEFEGHPHLVKLVLPEAFEGYPLRKSFALMTREAKEWPGLKEPE